MMQILILAIILLFISWVLTYVLRIVAIKKKVIDIPNERSSHSIPTPRGGGLAIVICWFLGITILFYLNQIEKQLYFAFLPGLLLAAISLIDDIISLKPKTRLIVQTITSLFAILIIFQIPVFDDLTTSILYFVKFGFAVIGMIWFINLYNFLDGIDGYASTETIMVALGIFLFTQNYAALILVFPVLGFLIWNWPKAKIFMGDVGSTQLGYIIAVLGVYLHQNEHLTLYYWLVLTAPFWFDATYTLFRRWRNNEKLSQAHRKHAYQRIVQAGFSHQKTDFCLVGFNSIIILLIYISLQFNFSMVPASVIILVLLILINRYIDTKKPFNS